MSSQPRTIVLFGKTGDGKSTVANMLLGGDVDGEFAAGNSLAVVTKHTEVKVVPESNWTIIDTVGMFGTDQPHLDVERTRQLRDYLAENHQAIDMFCYVKTASKFTSADEQCWEAFHTLFADHHNYHDNILLVFTACRKGWLEDNVNPIKDMMSGPLLNPKYSGERVIYRSIAVDFPRRDDDPTVESKLKSTRAAGLAMLKAAIEEAKQPLQLRRRADEPTHGFAERKRVFRFMAIFITLAVFAAPIVFFACERNFSLCLQLKLPCHSTF